MTIIHQQYIRTNQIFDSIKNQIDEDVKKSKYSLTCKALINNAIKIDFLLKGILDAEKSFYVSQVLSRILFEHYLVGHYIWTKLRIDEKDDVGDEYYKHYFCSEYFKQDNYNFGIDNIKDNSKNKLTIEGIRIQYPEFNDMEQSDLDGIHLISSQFDIRKIGNYLINKLPSDDIYKTIHTSMLDFLKKYNHLSSYIHGGPFSEMRTFDNEENIDKTKICLENIEWGEIASKQTKHNIIAALVLELPEKYLPIFKSMIS